MLMFAVGLKKLGIASRMAAKLQTAVTVESTFYLAKLQTLPVGEVRAHWTDVFNDFLRAMRAKSDVCQRLQQLARYVFDADDPLAADLEVSPKWDALTAVVHGLSTDAEIAAALSGESWCVMC